MRAVGVALLVAAVLTACGGDRTSSQTDDTALSTTPVQPATTAAPSTSTTTVEPTMTVPGESADESTTTSAAQEPAVYLTVLHPEGIGEVRFGTPADDAIAALSAMLGSPDRVETIEPVFADCVEGSSWLDCVHSRRVIDDGHLAVWDDVGLEVALVDTNPEGSQTALQFADWQATVGSDADALTTTEGISAGTTVGALKQAAPEVEFTYNEGALDSFYVWNDQTGGYWGRLDWDPATVEIEYRDVATVQAALNNHGAGLEVDGVWGPRTEAAWLTFLAAEGIEPAPRQLWLTPEIGAALGLPPDDITVATIEPRPPFDPAGTTATDVLSILRPDGLGPVDFGTAAEQAIPALTDLLGPPERATASTQPDCTLAIEQTTILAWESVGLHAVLTDWPGSTDLPPTPLHLATWTAWSAPTPPVALTTPDGIEIGSTASDVRALPNSSPFIPDVTRWGFEISDGTDTVKGDLGWSINLPYYSFDEQFTIELQHALNSHGADLDADGIVGPATIGALIDFATRHRIAQLSIEPSFDSIELTPEVLEVFWLLGLPPNDAPVTAMWAGDPSTCG